MPSDVLLIELHTTKHIPEPNDSLLARVKSDRTCDGDAGGPLVAAVSVALWLVESWVSTRDTENAVGVGVVDVVGAIWRNLILGQKALLRLRRVRWLASSSSSSAGNGNDGSGKKPPPKPKLANRLLSSLTPHENIYTLPNILTLSRLLAAPVVGYLVLHDQHAWAVGLFAYAAVTDLVDGYVARTWKLQTVVGTVIDPMADKTLMTVLTVCLAVKGALPVWLAAIILLRDAGLGVAAIYYRWISLPPPKTFTRYWDFSLPSAEVRPTGISKVNTALQLALIGATTALPLVSVDVGGLMVGMQYLVAATTVWSGASYVYSKDAVKILGRGEGNGGAAAEERKAKSETGAERP